MKDFALALLVGMTSGVYSTIYIASAFISFATLRKDKGISKEKAKPVRLARSRCKPSLETQPRPGPAVFFCPWRWPFSLSAARSLACEGELSRVGHERSDHHRAGEVLGTAWACVGRRGRRGSFSTAHPPRYTYGPLIQPLCPRAPPLGGVVILPRAIPSRTTFAAPRW
jgi:hypothetical protein